MFLVLEISISPEFVSSSGDVFLVLKKSPEFLSNSGEKSLEFVSSSGDVFPILEKKSPEFVASFRDVFSRICFLFWRYLQNLFLVLEMSSEFVSSSGEKYLQN